MEGLFQLVVELGLRVLFAIPLLLLGGFSIWLMAKVCGIEDVGFGEAILLEGLCTILMPIVLVVLMLPVLWIPLFGGLALVFVKFMLTIVAFRYLLETSWGKAFCCWFLSVVLSLTLFLSSLLALGGGLATVAAGLKAAKQATSSRPVGKRSRRAPVRLPAGSSAPTPLGHR